MLYATPCTFAAQIQSKMEESIIKMWGNLGGLSETFKYTERSVWYIWEEIVCVSSHYMFYMNNYLP